VGAALILSISRIVHSIALTPRSSRTIDELAAVRDEVLLGLLELRANAENARAARAPASRAG
jgi:hypothetical protein